METIVQWVRTSWTKQSRGGAEAARRNSAPVGFRLPGQQAPFVHEVSMAEMDGYEPRSQTFAGLGRTREAGLILRAEEGLLRVQLTVTPFGMPRRWRRPPAVRLRGGEWLRWQVNYRFAGTGDSDWTYRLDTVNVAYGLTAADVFLGVPTRHVKELAPLR